MWNPVIYIILYKVFFPLLGTSFGDSPKLLCVFEYFFLLLGDILSCEYTNICIWLFILFPMDIRALFNFEEFEYSYYEHSSFICAALNFLRKLGVEFWGHNEYIFIFYKRTINDFA